MSRTALSLVLLLLGGCLPNAMPRAPDGGDAALDGGDSGVDGGDAGEADAGVFCDPVPSVGCVSSGLYGARLDGGVFDYRGSCAGGELNATLGGGCCSPMTGVCSFSGGFSCTLPGNEAGSPPCCFDLCAGVPCDCRRSGSCGCSGTSCASTVQTYVCPVIGVRGP